MLKTQEVTEIIFPFHPLIVIVVYIENCIVFIGQRTVLEISGAKKKLIGLNTRI